MLKVRIPVERRTVERRHERRRQAAKPVSVDRRQNPDRRADNRRRALRRLTDTFTVKKKLFETDPRRPKRR
ncbi:MAG TPA: hypothetical protein PK876_00675 [Elusimicrobiota bacterium]|nr:hypothetical protein [Elusimicrobiota bacterium]